MLRRQLPAYSPLPFAAVAAAVAGKLGGMRDVETEIARTLQQHYRSRTLVLTASGTTALELALAGWVGARRGAVALPAYGCYDLATAADGADVPVVLYDVDPTTLGPDLRSLEHALALGALAVVVPHLYGLPVDVVALRKTVEAAGALLIEDAAQAIGATVRGEPAGALGALSILSFGRGKGVTAGGGGALLVNEEGARHAVESTLGDGFGGPMVRWSAVGALMAQWFLGRPWLYGIPASIPMLRLGETIYKPPARRRRMARSSCAVLSVTWPLTPAEVGHRSRNAARLLARISSREGVRPITPLAHAEPSYLRLPIVLTSHGSRADARSWLSLGVAPGYPKALADLAGFRGRCGNASDAFPGARELAARLVTLPTHSRLSEGDLRALERWVDGLPAAT